MRQNLGEWKALITKDLVHPTQVSLKHVWYQSVFNKNEWLILNPRFSLCVSSEIHSTLQANLGLSCIFLKIALHVSLVFFFFKESDLDF